MQMRMIFTGRDALIELLTSGRPYVQTIEVEADRVETTYSEHVAIVHTTADGRTMDAKEERLLATCVLSGPGVGDAAAATFLILAAPTIEGRVAACKSMLLHHAAFARAIVEIDGVEIGVFGAVVEDVARGAIGSRPRRVTQL